MTTEEQENRATTEDLPLGEDEGFLHRLKRFQNLFFQDCVKKATKQLLSTILQTLEEKQQRHEEDLRYDWHDEEKHKNIMTFLKWTLSHVQEAEMMAAREVHERPNNILALSNSAYVLWQKGTVDEAWERLTTLETLRAGDPQEYDGLDSDAQSEILYLFMKLGHLFKPYVISDLQEKLLSRRPHDENLKFTLGLILRRYTNLYYTTKHPEVDFTPAVSRAIELFVQIKDREENNPDLRAKAAAELGEILDRQEDKHIRVAVEEEKRRRGLTAEQCFNEAIQLAENNPAVLVWAGKYFRHQRNLNRSKELLGKAVTIRPESKAHHQLGITLKFLAFQENGRQQLAFASGEETTTVNAPCLSRKYLQEAIEHFRKSVELSNGGNDLALQDLGYVHFLLGEYDEALKHFKKIIDIFPLGSSFRFNLATKQASLVFEEIAKGERNEERRKALQEMSQFCLNLTLRNWCRQLLQKCRTTRWLNEAFWISFHSLHGALHRLRESSGKEEGQLLKAAKEYSETLPVLKEIFGYSEEQAVDASALESTVQDYLTNGRYDDALLFLSLLKLTQQRHVLGTWRDADVYVRVHVLVAKDRLLRCVGRDDVVTDFNVIVAKLMFRQAFQDVFCPVDKLMAAPILEDCREGPADGDQNDGCHGDNRSNEVERPRPGQDCLPRTTFPPEAAVNPGETSADVSSPELDDDVDDELKVLLLHDPRDKEAEGDARNLQTVLQEICGLKTTLMCDEARLGAGRSSLVDVATEMELLVFIVRSADVSPEFSTWIQEAINTTTAGGQVSLSNRPDSPASPQRLVTLVLNSSPLPSALQCHRSFPASSSELQELGQCHESRSEAGVQAACKLFCDLIGLQTELDGEEM